VGAWARRRAGVQACRQGLGLGWARKLTSTSICQGAEALALCWRSLHAHERRARRRQGSESREQGPGTRDQGPGSIRASASARESVFSSFFAAGLLLTSSCSSLLHCLFMLPGTSTNTAPTIFLLSCQPDTKPFAFLEKHFRGQMSHPTRVSLQRGHP
jgi:hypothetical protein